MTYDEITLFTRFMQDKGMLNNYEVFYRNHRFDKRELDTFLAEVDAKDAILAAFDLGAAPNTIFSVKYWQELHKKWMKRLGEYRETGVMVREAQIVCQHCGRLLPRSAFAYNPKGQLHKYCRECESGEWDRKRKEQEAADKEREKHEKAMRQLEKEIADKQAKLERLAAERKAKEEAEHEAEDEKLAKEIAKLEKTTKVCDHCGKRKKLSEFDESGTSPDGRQPWCRQCQEDVLKASEEADKTAPADGEVTVKTAPKLGEYDATLHYKDGTRRIVFNAVLSAQVQAAGLTKCYLSTERDRRQFLVFNNSEGANVTSVGTAGRTPTLAQVCSVGTCRQIADRFNLSYGELYYLHITRNLSKQKDIINVEVKNVRTREEYAAIAAGRDRVPGRDVPEWHGHEDVNDAPLIDFSEEEPEEQKPEPKKLNVKLTVGCAKSPEGIPLAGRKPADILQQLIEKGHLTERAIAKFLYDRGWKLQEPVVLKTHKRFKA